MDMYAYLSCGSPEPTVPRSWDSGRLHEELHAASPAEARGIPGLLVRNLQKDTIIWIYTKQYDFGTMATESKFLNSNPDPERGSFQKPEAL